MKNKDWIYFGILILCLVLIGFLINFMMEERSQCLKNPFVYGASKMGNVQCSCSQDVGRSLPAPFSFNDTTFDASPKEMEGGSLYIPINFGELNISK